MDVKDYIAYTYQGKCFSRSYTRASTGPLTGEQFHNVLEFVLKSMIPSNANKFGKWKNSLIKVLKKSKGERHAHLKFGKYEYARDLDGNDIAVELDFDNNCIVLDGSPLLKLQSGGYPSADTILENYGRNSGFFYISPNPLSHEHRDVYGYDIMEDSFVPPADRKALEYFDELQVDCQPVHTLLGLAAKESSCDIVSTKVREIYIGTYVHTFGLRILRWLVMKHPLDTAQLACARSLLGKFVAMALLPVHLLSSLRSPSWPRRSEFWWIKSYICVSFATHIHRQENASAAIALLVEYIRSKPNRPAMVFGVVSSFTHCMIIQVSNQDTSPILRTAVLEFMPSQNATDPSTPGISALVRLGNLNTLNDIWFFYTALKKMWWSDPGRNIRTAKPPPPSPPLNSNITDLTKVTILSLPLEVLTEIGSYLSTCLDLNSLAVTCKRTMSACIPLLRLPQLINTNPLCPNQYGYILTSYHSSLPSSAEDRPSRMLAGRFVAEHGGQKTLVLLAMDGVTVTAADRRTEVRGEYERAVEGAFYLPSAAFPIANEKSTNKMMFM